MSQAGTLNTNTYNDSCFFVDWSFAKNNGTIATLNFSIGIEMWNYAWWRTNAIVIKDVYIAGKKVTSGGTFSNKSGNPTNREVLITGSVDVPVNSEGKVDFKIQFNGWLYQNGDIYKEENFTLDGVKIAPILSLNEQSHTATTIKVNATSTNEITPEKYTFSMYDGNTLVKNSGEITSNSYEFTDLTPNKAYTIKAKGYANSSWGSEVSKSITTNSKSTISEIGDFTLDGTIITISGDSNCNVVVLVNGEEIIRRDNVSPGTYTLVLTEEEKKKIYELMGNNNYIVTTVRIETGTEKSDITKNITLTGDVFSCNILVNGVLKKGKVWVGTATGNKQGIFTIGTSNGNVRGR